MIRRQGKDWVVLGYGGIVIGKHREFGAAMKQYREYDGKDTSKIMTEAVEDSEPAPKPRPKRKPRTKKEADK